MERNSGLACVSGNPRKGEVWANLGNDATFSSLEGSEVEDCQHSVAFVYIRGGLSDQVLYPEAPYLAASDSPSPPHYSSPGKNSHSGL